MKTTTTTTITTHLLVLGGLKVMNSSKILSRLHLFKSVATRKKY
jgi:hypothetical protein